MEFEARAASLIDDGYCTVLAFASDAIDPRQFVILSVTNQPTSQDIELGQAGIHFELGGSKLSGYNVVKAIDAQSNQLLLKLDASAAKESGADPFVKINVIDPIIDGQPLAVIVDQFKSRLPAAGA
jgi:hypothetical protein